MQKKDEYQKAAFVACDADLIGDVVLEEDSSIWFHAVLRGDHEQDPHWKRQQYTGWMYSPCR